MEEGESRRAGLSRADMALLSSQESAKSKPPQPRLGARAPGASRAAGGEAAGAPLRRRVPLLARNLMRRFGKELIG